MHLTKTEFRLLCELATSPGKVFSREHLLERVWGYDYFGDGRLVDVHVRRLRTKVETDAGPPPSRRDGAWPGVQAPGLTDVEPIFRAVRRLRLRARIVFAFVLGSAAAGRHAGHLDVLAHPQLDAARP